ncbi:histidine phosphatase family protein [Desulfosediminicola flagellatus]|uniref:histidine phosphatase family protein n=1 Tax=Desulfosediminicola flagellatus TaxID=2569541 RepID=UPI00142F1AE2|nr:histidine phosphatase family protein [Desulfosediminicola flagellatus]
MTTSITSPKYSYGLLRHGETVWNSEKRVQGHGDSPLTLKGRESLEKWAGLLGEGNWQRILSSDLGRVKETVSIINSHLNLPISEDPRLREQNWGQWEGLKVSEVREHFGDELANQVNKGWDFCPPGGESRRDTQKRVFEALHDSRRHYPEQNVLVACHLGVIKCVLYTIAGRNFMDDEPQLIEKHCMHEITFQHHTYHLGQLNISVDL